MRTCEVCGRPIRSGYKYCWEHRHTSQAEALRGDRLFKKAEKLYWQFTAMKYYVGGFFLLFLVVYLVFYLDKELFFSVFMGAIFVGVIIFFIPLVLRNRIVKSKACEEYVSKYLRKHKEEQERRNRI